MAGTWVGSWTTGVDKEHKRGSNSERTGSLRLSLTQYGRAVTGSATLTSLPSDRPGQLGSCGSTASVSGVVAAEQVSLTLADGGHDSSGTIQGQVAGDTLSGSYRGACVASATLLLQRE